jgi:hypothetical protein
MNKMYGKNSVRVCGGFQCTFGTGGARLESHRHIAEQKPYIGLISGLGLDGVFSGRNVARTWIGGDWIVLL